MMKFFVLIATSMFMAGEARAINNCPNTVIGAPSDCYVNITIDSGTGRSCNGDSTSDCTCFEVYGGVAQTTCYEGWDPVSATIGGKTCCVNGNAPANVPAVPSVESSSVSHDLADAFRPDVTATYYGYVDTTLRSPSTGRGNSAHAKLDACLFYSDVDSLGTGYTAWNNCKTSTTVGCNASNKNEYCMSNGAAVCEDRCDCVFTGFDTCDGL